MAHPGYKLYLTNLLLFRVWSADRQHFCQVEIDRSVAYQTPPQTYRIKIFSVSRSPGDLYTQSSFRSTVLINGQLVTRACASTSNIAQIQARAWVGVSNIFPACTRQL